MLNEQYAIARPSDVLLSVCHTGGSVNKMPRYRRDDRAMTLYISMRQRAVSRLPYHAFFIGLCLQTAVNYLSTRSPILGLMWAGTLSYSAVKVFQPMWSQYLNVTDRQTDGRYTVTSPHGKNRETKYRRYYRYRRYFKLKYRYIVDLKNRHVCIVCIGLVMTRPIHTPTGLWTCAIN